MASSRATKLRIARSVLGARGFFDAIAGRFVLDRARPGPPPPRAEPSLVDLAGALHVHTCTYSDGAGDVPTVMAAARAAGVDFVLLTDHNTLAPRRDGWEARYRDDLPFLIVGTEITVEHGAFLLALDLPGDYAPDVRKPAQPTIDAVRAHGGFPLVSLPYDMKHPWRDWEATGFDGLEVLNLSTIARQHINLLSLLWLLPLWRIAGEPAVLKAIAARPDDALARWDALLAQGRTMVGIGSLDAHALMKIGAHKYPIPSYEESFTATRTHVLIPSSTAPEARADAVSAALRAGRCYFAYDCLGDPRDVGLAFSTDAGVAMGARAPLGATLTAHCDDPQVLLRLYHRGKVVASGIGGLVHRADGPGAYRLEAMRFHARIGPLFLNVRPWVFTNPIYIDPI